MRERRVLVDADDRILKRVLECGAPAGLRLEPAALASLCPDADGVSGAVVQLPGRGGLDGLRRVACLSPTPALLALCPPGNLELALLALKEGADDYVTLPLDPDELWIRLERALERRGEIERRESRRPPAPFLTGESGAIREVRHRVARLASGDFPVLITGEIGTGKRRVAAAIHDASHRRAGPFVAVDCAGRPEMVLENEIFGHERGAFTGAERRRSGRLEEAEGGTLLLADVADVPSRVQQKLLRTLREGEFERLGGRAPVRADVRILAATSCDLAERISRRLFREDLFIRLNEVSIRLPSLRERPGDVPRLAEEFRAAFNRETARPKRGFAPGVLEALAERRWSANVRELRNAVERAVLLGEGEWIGALDLGIPGLGDPGSAEPTDLVRLPEGGTDYRLVERTLILLALERANWIQKDAAPLLQMSRRRLNYRIRRLGITHPSWRRNRPESATSDEGGDLC